MSIYLGKDTAAHTVKKIYIGVEGLARPVKKGYIGIDGVARQFFGKGDTEYFEVETLSNARDIDSLAYGGGKYAAINLLYGNSPYIGDSLTSLAEAENSYSKHFTRVVYGNGVFVAANCNDADEDDYPVIVSNGTTAWMPAVTASLNQFDWQEISFGNGRFAMLGFSEADSQFVSAISTNGNNWTIYKLGAYSYISIESLQFVNGAFMLYGRFKGTGNTRGYFGVSTDGINWDLSEGPINADGSYSSVAINYLSLGGNTSVFTQATSDIFTLQALDESRPSLLTLTHRVSDDECLGITWRTAFFDGENFSVFSYNYDYLARSKNGLDWKYTKLPKMPDNHRISDNLGYVNGQFVLLCRTSSSNYYFLTITPKKEG